MLQQFGRRLSSFLPSAHTAENGQILLVVVLVMVVVLTIGLSLATRNITNLRQSSEEDQSQRAFSAAEAGIQIALQGNAVDVPRTTLNNSSTYEARRLPDAQIQEYFVNNGGIVTKNEAVDVWLATYNATFTPKWTGRLNIYWGDSTTACNNPALDIVVLTGDISSPVVTQYAYDPCLANRASNNFSAPEDGTYTRSNGKTYRHRVTIPPDGSSPVLMSNGLLARIIPLNGSTMISVASDSVTRPLPVQQKIIESIGTAGETKRKIVVSQGFPKLPLELFPYTLFIPAQP